MSEDTGECVSCDKLSEQVEKLTKERDELHRAFNQPVPRSEWEKMQEQLAATRAENEACAKVAEQMPPVRVTRWSGQEGCRPATRREIAEAIRARMKS